MKRTRDILDSILNLLGHMIGISLVIFIVYFFRDGKVYREHMQKLEADTTYQKYRQYETLPIVLDK